MPSASRALRHLIDRREDRIAALARIFAGGLGLYAGHAIDAGRHHRVEIERALQAGTVVQHLERRDFHFLEILGEDAVHRRARRRLVVIGDLLADRRGLDGVDGEVLVLVRFLHLLEDFGFAAAVVGEMRLFDDPHADDVLLLQEAVRLHACGSSEGITSLMAHRPLFQV